MMKSECIFVWNGHICVGSKLPLEQRKMVILNSAQSKYPLGGDEWILGTLEALRCYAKKGWTLLGSLGLNTWELTSWAGGVSGFPLLITIMWDGRGDPIEIYQALIQDFDLLAEMTTLLFLPVEKKQNKKSGPQRDHFIASLADTIVPVSVRPGGKMEALLASHSDGKTDSSFQRNWGDNHKREHYLFDIAALQRDLDPRYKGWIFHWTRANPGPWPGETRADYFKGVVESREEYTHSARKTLRRIVDEKRIRATSWRIRGKDIVVCLSGLPLSMATRLMRWRSRFVRFTAEPYGIGLSPATVKRMKIHPVVYIPSGSAPPDGIPAFLLQGSGSSGDWPQEDEYRHQGDIDLKTLKPDEWEPVDLTGYRRL